MARQLFQVSSQHDRSVKNMINSALHDLGGLHHLIPPGKRILIKPNLVIAKNNDTGATTNPKIIEVLIQEALKTNPLEISLGESSTAGDDTMKAFQLTAENKGVRSSHLTFKPKIIQRMVLHFTVLIIRWRNI